AGYACLRRFQRELIRSCAMAGANPLHSGGRYLALRFAPYRALAGNEVRRAAARQWLASANSVGDLLGDHDGGGVEVAGDDLRHDRGIHHAQALKAMHAALAVDHRHVVFAHLARAGWVEGGFRMFANEGVQFRIALAVDPRADFAATVRVECRLRHDLAGDADGVAELLPVLLM